MTSALKSTKATVIRGKSFRSSFPRIVGRSLEVSVSRRNFLKLAVAAPVAAPQLAAAAAHEIRHQALMMRLGNMPFTPGAFDPAKSYVVGSDGGFVVPEHLRADVEKMLGAAGKMPDGIVGSTPQSIIPDEIGLEDDFYPGAEEEYLERERELQSELEEPCAEEQVSEVRGEVDDAEAAAPRLVSNIPAW